MTISTSLIFAISLSIIGLVSGTFMRRSRTSQSKSVNSAPRRLRSRKRNIPNLILFVHPRCPDTMATVRQLRNTLFNNKKQVSVRMVVLCPRGCSDSWYETPLLEEANRIPGLEIVLDYGGVLTKKYGVISSGTMLVYDQKSLLTFQGGITPASGHEGKCPGQRSLEQSLAGQLPDARQTLVFGCQLFA